MLKEAATEKEIFLNFINIEIVGELKYTNGRNFTKSELLHQVFIVSFFSGTSILRNT